MRAIAHVEIRRELFEDEAHPEEVGVHEVAILFEREIRRMVPAFPGDVDGPRREAVRSRFEVHVAAPDGKGHIAVFREMDARAIRLAFEEFADVV